MRILYLHQHYVGPAGSGGGRSHEFARRLVRSGHSVTLVTGAHAQSGLRIPDGSTRTQLFVDGIDIRVLGVPYAQHMSPRQRVLAFLRFALGACREAARIAPVDVVFATSTPLTIAIPALWAAVWHGSPFVFEVRDLWPAAPIELGFLESPLLIATTRAFERFVYRRATHIVALSDGMKAGVTRTGVPADKVTVIPNASDTSTFRVPCEEGEAYRAAQGALGSRPWVMYAGTLGRVNAVEWVVPLADAVAQLDPRVAFVLVGAGSEKERTVAMARARGLLDRAVFFRDPAPRAELARVLSAATVLSSLCVDLPVMRTNSANKLFDAFAAGKPALVNYGGWQAELLEREGAGLALDPRDIEGSARRLVAALRDPAWLERAAASSRRLGDTVFARERLADMFEGVLRRAALSGQASWSTRAMAAARARSARLCRSRTLKRALDVVVASTALVAGAPLLAAVAVAVRAGLGRPVLFRQLRPGQHGRPFELVKFRSMLDARDADGRPLPDAARLTRLGRLLRASSLDELPELWNVLRGDMSLVGPRPLLLAYLDRYTPEQARRHEVPPGLTGWAAVRGRNALTWEEKLALDVWYVDHWSLGLDLRILARTALAVLRREGISAEGHATMPEFLGTAAPAR